MKREIQVGKTDYSVFVFIPDSAQTDGSGKTGLVAANLTVSGARMETDNDVTITDYTGSLNNLASITAAHNDWGVIEVSSSLAPGLYRLDIADAIFASGAWTAVVYVMVTTSAAAPSPMEFVLVTHDPDDLGTKQSGDSYTRVGAPVGASISADIAAVQADTDNIQTRLPTSLVSGRIDASVGAVASGAITAAAIATGAIDADALATDAINEIADGYLDRDMSVGTDSGSETVRTPRQAMRYLRNKVLPSGGTGTVYKEDDSTTSWTFTYTTDPAAEPITSIDPASS